MSTPKVSPNFCYTVKSGLAIAAPPQPVEFKTNPKLMCVDAVISTAAMDRQGEIIEPNGLLMDDSGQPLEYANQPVVLYDHRQAWPLPIGLAEGPDGRCTVRKSANEIVSTNYFSQTCRFAEQVFKLMDEGILRGWSVGFHPIEGTQIGTRPDGKHKSYHYTQWKLVEQSVTPTPQNPEALTIYVQKSQPGTMLPQLVESLKPFLLTSRVSMLMPVEKKSMDSPTPEGAAPPAPPEPKPDAPPQEGKKLKPSARKLLDCIQQCTDIALSWDAGWDDIEHENAEDDVSEAIEGLELIRDKLSESLSDYHGIKSELPKLGTPASRRGEADTPKNDGDESGDKPAGDKPPGEKVEKQDGDKDKPEKKDDKEDYESRFKKSVIVAKGYHYVPRRAWLPPAVEKSEADANKLSADEEKELQRELMEMKKDMREAARLKRRSALRLAQ